MFPSVFQQDRAQAVEFLELLLPDGIADFTQCNISRDQDISRDGHQPVGAFDIIGQIAQDMDDITENGHIARMIQRRVGQRRGIADFRIKSRGKQVDENRCRCCRCPFAIGNEVVPFIHRLFGNVAAQGIRQINPWINIQIASAQR